MYGRYGTDKLSYAMWILSIVIYLGCMFVPWGIVRMILQILSTALLVLVFFRMFSKNIYARRAENNKFLKMTKPIGSFFKVSFNRIKYRKTHCYRKCPHCKNMLKLPKVRGEHRVACPVCGESFKVNI